jgi:hypothetical protein
VEEALSREKIEKSELLRRMQEVCDEINKKAGTLVIDSHSYLPPQPILRAFIVTKGSRDYVMQISLSHSEPRLVFLRQSWRNNAFVCWVRELLRIPLKPRISLERRFQPEDVTRSDVESWFAYLVSGLKRRLTPQVSVAKRPAA